MTDAIIIILLLIAVFLFQSVYHWFQYFIKLNDMNVNSYDLERHHNYAVTSIFVLSSLVVLAFVVNFLFK